MLRLVGYSDYICPFCYLGGVMMNETLQAYDATLEWRGFEIHPEVPEDGVPMEQLDPRILNGLKQSVGVIAGRHGIPMQLPSRLPNSRRALLAAEYAREADHAGAYHDALFRAYFTEDRDIGRVAVLQEIAGEVGLDAEDLGRAVTDRVAEPILDRNRADCERLGITGVPTWIIGDGFKLVGALPPAHLRAALDDVAAQLSHPEAADA